ncbi:MAG: hypothetical protein AAF530_04410 [Pseudomonadota bacterium]
MLILIGVADEWTNFLHCENMALKNPIDANVALKVYQEAIYAFDEDWPGGRYYGHTIDPDPDPRKHAIVKINAFLADRLKNCQRDSIEQSDRDGAAKSALPPFSNKGVARA